MYRTITFTRSELFEKVWATPLLKLARGIGVSDVALGKACRRAAIPLPGRGYWAKAVEARRVPSLPDTADPARATIAFQVLDVPAPEQRIATPKAPRELIEVPETLDEKPHPLVAKTRKCAKKCKVNEGRLALDFSQALHIRISPDVLDRVLRLLDSLIKASEVKGYRWSITPEGKTVIECDGESMAVELKERVPRREVPRKPAPSPQRSRHGWSPDLGYLDYTNRYEWVSTNELSFHIDEYISGSAQRTWNDTKHSRLEEKLDLILAGLPAVAAGLKAKREEREAWQRSYEEERRREREEARRAETQRRLRKRLVRAMQDWERAARLRHFCDAVEARCYDLDSARRATATAWLAWAREQADALDPLHHGLAALLSSAVELPEWFPGESYGYSRPKSDWWTLGDSEAE
ncbi:MAG TPA: hypothetical protein VJQ86_06435 [Rhodanobacteraceae bacterium]|nr:hypothetical protein [Rhodanobacteraceae bacterium]